nr:glutathione s-transferase-like protein usts [Quercus suber]
MASKTEIVLFDLASRAPQTCWSLNPWKTRLALNYKAIPYTTEWLEYPQLGPVLQSHNVPPNSASTNPNATYSSPCIRLPNGEFVMDSLAIAHALDALQPEPSLFADAPSVDHAQGIADKIRVALSPIWTPRVPEMLLNPVSAEYFSRTRAQRLGMSLTELAQRTGDGGEAWNAAEPALAELQALLRESAAGPFVMGETVSFADFILAGFCRFMQRLDVDGDLFGKLMAKVEPLAAHFEACQPWLARGD